MTSSATTSCIGYPAKVAHKPSRSHIQLTAELDQAHTPEMWEKRLKLRELMEPILVK